MQYTENYGYKKPEYGEKARVDDLNYNATLSDNLMKNTRDMLAEYFSQTKAYKADEVVQLEGKMYRFKVDHAAGNFNPAEVDEEPLGNMLGSSMPPITAEAEGNPIELTDAASAPMVRCEAEIQGSQDLHGYDKPWVGGAGKNKVSSAETWTIGSDGEIISYAGYKSPIAKVESGKTYIFSINGVATVPQTYAFYSSYPTIGSYSYDGTRVIPSAYTFTAPIDGYIVARYADTVDDKIQIELGATATSYEPYSNICPISGFSEVDIDGCGKNLALLSDGVSQQSYALNASYTDTGATYTAIGTYARSVYKYTLPLVVGKKYTLSFDGSSTGDFNNVYFGSTNELRSSDYGYKTLTSAETSQNITFTAKSKDMYMTVYVTSSATSGVMTLNNFQIESGEVKTGFDEYKQGNSYTIDLNGTRYGGELDVCRGVLRVTHEVKLASEMGWNAVSLDGGTGFRTIASSIKISGKEADFKSSHFYTYASSASDFINGYMRNRSGNYYNLELMYDQVTTTTELSNWFTAQANAGTPVQIYLPLVEPLEITLTPTAIRSLLGNNYMACNTGDMEIEYITQDYQPLVDLIEANSGKHVYSTTEKIVGTWIDGSDVYERVIHFDPEISISTSFASCGVDSTNMNKAIYVYAIHPDGTGYGDVMADPGLSNHTLLGLKASTQHTTEYIIIRYTKSS